MDDLEVRELTVGEIRQWLAEQVAADLSLGNDLSHTVSLMLFEELPSLADLPTFTNLTAERIEQMKPSELAAVRDRVKAVNVHFFDLLARLAALGMKSLTNSAYAASQ